MAGAYQVRHLLQWHQLFNSCASGALFSSECGCTRRQRASAQPSDSKGEPPRAALYDMQRVGVIDLQGHGR